MVGFFSLCLCGKKVVSSPTKLDQDENTKKSRDRFARQTEESTNDNDDKDEKEEEKEEEEEEETRKPIPLPPGMTNKKTSAEADSIPPTNYRKTRTKSMAAMPSSSSSKKLLVSLSMKVRPGGKKGKVLKHEDSIWKKTIILGERCRVPDEEDDAVCFDENGNRISTYHPRISNSVPVSRQNSFIDEDAIPKHHRHRHRHRHRREGNCSSSSSSSSATALN